MGSALSRVSEVLRVPDRASHLAKVEHVVALLLALQLARSAVKMGPRGVYEYAVTSVLAGVKVVPGLAGVVEGEKKKIIKDIEDFVLHGEVDTDPHRALPAEGLSKDEVLAKLTELRGKETKFHDKKSMGGIYHLDNDDLSVVQTEAFRIYNCSNALYPGLFPSVRKFEAEIVRMALTFVNGDKTSCGTLTSGGTESVLLAVHAYAKMAAARGIAKPEIVACTSSHPALNKGGDYFHVKIVCVPVGDDGCMDVAAAAKAINRNTIAIYASAPSFPYGCIDDVPALSDLALKKGVYLHVDNCLGGFVSSFMKKEGLLDAEFDFSVPGVTSMSVDVHKYGFGPKGSSLILYRNPELRAHQFCAVTDFQGGLYCTPTMQGSRSGAIMAAAWATLMFTGESGYRAFARKASEMHKRIVKEINDIPGLQVIGKPSVSVVGYKSDKFNIYEFADRMSERGWDVPRLQRPAAVHICLGESTAIILDDYLRDVRECAAICMTNPGKVGEGMAGIYGMAGDLPDRGMVADILRSYCDVLYKVPGDD